RWRPTLTAIGSPPTGPLYDARRDVYYAKPVLRGWSHLLWFPASLVLGPLGPKTAASAGCKPVRSGGSAGLYPELRNELTSE
ncbi:MAG: hypothetical protein ABR922_14435, partial [Streptosporangiaceae bacterium]